MLFLVTCGMHSLYRWKNEPAVYSKKIFCKQATDLKIDWIWHLLLEIEAGVIGPTLLSFSITKSRFSSLYSFIYTLIININEKTRKCL